MKKQQQGFTLIELMLVLTIMVIVGVGLTIAIRGSTHRQDTASKIDIYVELVQTALDAYVSTQWQECIPLTSVTIDDLVLDGYLHIDAYDFKTEINLETRKDIDNSDYSFFSTIKISVENLEIAKEISKYRVFSKIEKDNQGSITVTFRHSLSPFKKGGRYNDYLRSQFPYDLSKAKYCFYQ